MTDITHEEILSQRTPNNGWSKATLAQWGVPWPPPKGWKKQIQKHGYPYSAESNEGKEKIAIDQVAEQSN